MTFRTASAEETVALGERLGALLRPGDIIALEGNLAAGKTTITKGIARALGVDDTITSPTFCLVSEYAGKMPLYHFDVYRLQGADDFANLGADEMLYGNGVCVIEWSEKIIEELPSRTIKIRIENEAREGSDYPAHSARTIIVENWPYENFGGEK